MSEKHDLESIQDHYERVQEAILKNIVIAFEMADAGVNYTVCIGAHPADTQSYYAGYRVKKVRRGYQLTGEGEAIDFRTHKPEELFIKADTPRKAAKKFLTRLRGARLNTQEGLEYAEVDMDYTPREIADTWWTQRSTKEKSS